MPYDVASPWAAAASAMGGYLDAKNKQKQQDFTNQMATQDQARQEALAQASVANTNQNIAASKAQVTREDLDSASNRVHQAATDALDQAKFTYQQTKDAADYTQKQQEINNAMTLGLAQIANAKSMAELQSKTSLAVASISAATQRRGQDISASTERRGQDVSAGTAAANRAENAREFNVGDTTTRRGQDLTAQEYASGARGRNTSPTAIQDATAIRVGETTLKTLGVRRPNDPNLDAVLEQFADPANRQAILADPNMPPESKQYLVKLNGLLPVTPTPRPTSSP